MGKVVRSYSEHPSILGLVKQFLPLTALIALLASCMPAPVIPPAESVTGYWKGDISKYGMSVDVSAHLSLADTPNVGDFTGKANLRGVISKDDVEVTGNVMKGTLVAAQGADVVSCKGEFKNNNKFLGSCSYGGYSAPITLIRQGD